MKKFKHVLVYMSLIFLSSCGFMMQQPVQQPKEFTLTVTDRVTETVLFKNIVNTEYDPESNVIDLYYKDGTSDSIRYTDKIKIISPYGELIIRDKVWYLIDETGNNRKL